MVDGFQNAKDTFYVTLRDRLAARNADRTVVVRGATRPAVVVEENEMATAGAAGGRASVSTNGRTSVVPGAATGGAVGSRTGGRASVVTGGTADPVDAFVLRWTDWTVDVSERIPLERGRCEIRFATAGSPEMAGMDRGRVLDAMSDELCAMLLPSVTGKRSFSVSPAVLLQTNVFWSRPAFGPLVVFADRIGRVAVVDVFAWKEAA